MVRCAIQVMLGAALGAATSIAIAWSAALVPHRGSQAASESVAWSSDATGQVVICREGRCSPTLRMVYMFLNVGVVNENTISVRGSGLGGGEVAEYRRVTEPPRTCHVPSTCNARSEYQFGWPSACMWGAADQDSYGCVAELRPPVHVMRIWPRAGTVDRTKFPPEEMVPFTPFAETRVANVPSGVMWSGMITNSGLFATAWWVLLFAPRELRHFVRRRKGRCVSCAYDLVGLPIGAPCPECGLAAIADESRA